MKVPETVTPIMNINSLSATDPGGLLDEQQINIAVTNLNETPEILSGGDATSLNFDVQENNSQVSTIVASDPDGDVIEFSIPEQNDYSRFVINRTSGSLSFSYPPNFEDPLDDNADNSYQIKIRASDGKGLYAEKEVIVTVTDYSLEDSDNDGLLESEEDALGTSDLTRIQMETNSDPSEEHLDPKANDSTDDPDEDFLHNPRLNPKWIRLPMTRIPTMTDCWTAGKSTLQKRTFEA